MKSGGIPELPKDCENLRIHSSGDFFSQAYFNMWVQIARDNPNVNFWAFTKSIQYWLNSIDMIPDNLLLTASYGGKQDELIEKYNLRYAKVYSTLDEVPEGMPIDTNDKYARLPNVNFALVDNFNKSNKT